MICGPLGQYTHTDKAYVSRDLKRHWVEHLDGDKFSRVQAQPHGGDVHDGAWQEVIASRYAPDGTIEWGGIHREDARTVEETYEWRDRWEAILTDAAMERLAAIAAYKVGLE